MVFLPSLSLERTRKIPPRVMSAVFYGHLDRVEGVSDLFKSFLQG